MTKPAASSGREFVTADQSLLGFVLQGLGIATVGTLGSLMYLHGPWATVGIAVAVVLGAVLVAFGRPSGWWIEGSALHSGNLRNFSALDMHSVRDIRTEFVPYGPRSVVLVGQGVQIGVPITPGTAELRTELGRLFREQWPTRVLADRRAMAALFLVGESQ